MKMICFFLSKLRTIGFFILLFMCCCGALGAAEILLGKNSFRPGDTMETVITVSRQGWYSISVQSPLGTGLSLIDRMSGQLEKSGRAGEKDGQIVRLLEAGEYKVRLQAATNPDNVMRLKVEEFTERNGSGRGGKALPFLQKQAWIQTELDNLQLRSYWIRIAEGDSLDLEIMGRHLLTCQLWREGEWREDIRPQQSTRTVLSGQPMGYFEFYHAPAAGLYLLQCVGGTGRQWSEEEAEMPLYIRRGTGNLGAENYLEWEISPFGQDGFLVSGRANYFQLQRDDKAATALVLRRYNNGASRFSGSQRRASISKESREPFCRINYSYRGETQWLFIEGTPGDRVRLLFFPENNQYNFKAEDNGKRFWISSLSSYGAAFSPDVGAWMTSAEGEDEPYIEGGAYPAVGRGNMLARKINLLTASQMLLAVEDDGEYYVREEVDPQGGATAEYRIIFYNDAEAFRYAEKLPPGRPFLLKKGFHIMEMTPQKVGVLNFVLYHKNDSSQAAAVKGAGFQAPVSHFILHNQAVRTGPFRQQTLIVGQLRDVATGLVVRQEPISLAQPLVFYLAAGAETTVPLAIAAQSVLGVQGEGAQLSLDGRTGSRGMVLTPGAHTLVLRNTGNAGSYYALSAGAPAGEAVPDLAPSEVQVEEYPLLRPGKPLFSDYKRRESRRFLVEVTEPAFYRLKTSGRLAMGMAVRTPIDPQLFSAAENTTGRNALIQAYLKPGVYLVQTETRSVSMGRAGLSLVKNLPREGGRLAEDAIYRTTLEQDEAVRFLLQLPAEAAYRLETLGLGKSFSYRLEDSGGWPLVVKGTGSFNGKLPQGSYSYYSLPEPYKTRRLTTFVRSGEKLTLPDSGENRLQLNVAHRSHWQEQEGRPPDIYTLAVPAPLPLSLSVSEGMELEVRKAADNSLLPVDEESSFPLEFESGQYTLAVKSREVNNDYPYSLKASTTQLAPGLEKKLSRFPATVRLSNPSPRIINLMSFGTTDVKATLFDSSGAILAENDDQPGDWNFKISRKLAAGKYLLKVELSGGTRGNTSVRMEVMEEVTLPSTALPFRYAKETAAKVLKLPFTTGHSPGLYSILAAGAINASLALYHGDRLLTEAENRLFIPLSGGTVYTLHMWHRENKPVLLDVALDIVASPVFTFRNRTEELEMRKALRIENEAGLSYLPGGDTSALLFSPAVEQPCLPVKYFPLSSLETSGWLVDGQLAYSRKITLRPVYLKPGRTRSFSLGREEQSFGLSYYGSAILMLQALSPGNLPGVQILAEEKYKRRDYAWDGLLFTARGTLAGIPGKGEFTGKLWNISGEERKIPVSLSTLSFPLQARESLQRGESAQLSLKPGYGCTFLLEEGPQRLDLLLPRQLVAFAWKEGRSVGIVAAESGNLATGLDVSGGAVSVVNTGKKAALLRVTSGPLTTVVLQEVNGRAGYEGVFTAPGRLRLKVTPGTGMEVLCVAGAFDTALLGGQDGRLDSGQNQGGLPAVQVYALQSAVLDIAFRAGYLKVWQSTREKIFSNFVARPGGLKAAALLKAGILTDSSQLWSFKLASDAYIQLDADTPGVTALYSAGKLVAATAGDGGGRQLFYYLKAGACQVYTRPLSGTEQRGSLRLSRLYPRTLEEGRQVPTLIGPGENHVYSFEVTARGKVGAGIKAEMDVLEVRLFDSAFTPLGKGPLLFNELEAGRYYLIVHSPAETVQYTPLVLGTAGSVAEIPADVIGSYKEGR